MSTVLSLGSVATLRRAQDSDVASIHTIELACFSSAGELFNRRQIRRLITSPTATTHVAELDGQIAGWSAGLFRVNQGRVSARLYAVAVHPASRRAGLGVRLTQVVLDQLTLRGAKKISLEVRADNHGAVTLYERFGFRVACALPDYYGDGIHAIRMRKVVESRAAAALGVIPPTLSVPAQVPDSAGLEPLSA